MQMQTQFPVAVIYKDSADNDGVILFQYRGTVIVRDAIEEGGGFYIEEQDGAPGPDVVFDTLDDACRFVDAASAQLDFWQWQATRRSSDLN